MEWLLPKKDQERLALHRYLTSKSSLAVLIKDIMADLGWSRYMVLQNVETLRVDYQQVGDGNIVYLRLVDSNRALQVDQLQTISDTALLGEYIRNSLQFDVLMDIFLEVAQSNEMIALRHSSSTTVSRVTKVEVGEKLEKFGIQISDDYQLVGDERNIRILLFEALYTAYADQPTPFPADVQAATDKVEAIIEEQTHIRTTVKKAFRIFFGIWYTRLKHGHVIGDYNHQLFKPDTDLSRHARMIIDKLREVITLSFDNQAPWFDEELRFGLGSIYSLGIGSGSYRVANLVPDVRRKFQEIYDDVCEVYQEFFGLSLSQPELELIQKALFSLNFRMLFFRQNGITHPINRQFSMSTFPIHTAFTERVVARIAPYFGLSEAEVSTAIFNEYLNTFVLVLNNSEILPVINVTVDMIDMPALEQIIIERLSKWQSVNLNITTEFTSETDLYISDVQLDSQVPGFAWRSFPENPEEKALHEKLIELTVQRFQALTGKI